MSMYLRVFKKFLHDFPALPWRNAKAYSGDLMLMSLGTFVSTMSKIMKRAL